MDSPNFSTTPGSFYISRKGLILIEVMDKDSDDDGVEWITYRWHNAIGDHSSMEYRDTRADVYRWVTEVQGSLIPNHQGRALLSMWGFNRDKQTK